MTQVQQPHVRTFYLMTMTQILSLIGSRMTGFAIGLWIYLDTGKTTPLLLVSFFQTLPPMLTGSLAGVFADRLDRRKIIMLTDAGQAIPTALLALAFFTNNFRVEMLYAAALVSATFQTLQGSALSAAITMLVPDEQRDRANMLQQLMGPLAAIIGPLTASMLYSLIQIEGIMLLDFITFLIAVAVMSQVMIPSPKESEEGKASKGSVWSEMRGGFRFLQTRPVLLGIILYATLVNFLINGPFSLATPYIIGLTGNEKLAGGLMAVLHIGMVTGGLLFGMWGGTRRRVHTSMGGLLIMSVLVIALGLARTPLLLGLVMLFVLLPNPAVNAGFVSLIQAKAPPDMQGRIFSIVMQLSVLMTPISYLITGPLVDRVLEPAVGRAGWWSAVAPIVGSETGSGMGLLMVISGAICVLATLGTWAVPHVRSVEVDLPDYVAEVPDYEINKETTLLEIEIVAA